MVVIKYIDWSGYVLLIVGKGDMLVWVFKDGWFGYFKLLFGKDNELKIILDKNVSEIYLFLLDIVFFVEGVNLFEVILE